MTTPNDPLEFKNSIPIHDQKFLEKQNKNQFLPGQKNYNSLGSEENIHLKKLAQTLRNHSSSKRTKKLHFLSKSTQKSDTLCCVCPCVSLWTENRWVRLEAAWDAQLGRRKTQRGPKTLLRRLLLQINVEIAHIPGYNSSYDGGGAVIYINKGFFT